MPSRRWLETWKRNSSGLTWSAPCVPGETSMEEKIEVSETSMRRQKRGRRIDVGGYCSIEYVMMCTLRSELGCGKDDEGRWESEEEVKADSSGHGLMVDG